MIGSPKNPSSQEMLIFGASKNTHKLVWLDVPSWKLTYSPFKRQFWVGICWFRSWVTGKFPTKPGRIVVVNSEGPILLRDSHGTSLVDEFTDPWMVDFYGFHVGTLGIQSPNLRMVMEPMLKRWLDILIIIWEYDWIPYGECRYKYSIRTDPIGMILRANVKKTTLTLLLVCVGGLDCPLGHFKGMAGLLRWWLNQPTWNMDHLPPKPRGEKSFQIFEKPPPSLSHSNNVWYIYLHVLSQMLWQMLVNIQCMDPVWRVHLLFSFQPTILFVCKVRTCWPATKHTTSTTNLSRLTGWPRYQWVNCKTNKHCRKPRCSLPSLQWPLKKFPERTTPAPPPHPSVGWKWWKDFSQVTFLAVFFGWCFFNVLVGEISWESKGTLRKATPTQEIAGLIRVLLRDNDGLHKPLIRPAISWFRFTWKYGDSKSTLEPSDLKKMNDQNPTIYIHEWLKFVVNI